MSKDAEDALIQCIHDHEDLLMRVAIELRELAKKLNIDCSPTKPTHYSDEIQPIADNTEGPGESHLLIQENPYPYDSHTSMRIELINDSPREYKVTVLKSRERGISNDNQ